MNNFNTDGLRRMQQYVHWNDYPSLNQNLLTEAADEIDRLRCPWIATSERLPNDKIESFHGGPEGSWGCQVLLRIHQYRSEVVYFDSDDKCFWLRGEKVTGDDWMPIPKVPEKEKQV